MPIDPTCIVSDSEGNTPVVYLPGVSKALGIHLWVKLEIVNPTGTFKDREASYVLSSSRQHNQENIVMQSTGNTAIAITHYAGLAGIPSWAFIPETSNYKLLMPKKSDSSRIVAVNGHPIDFKCMAEDFALRYGFPKVSPFYERCEANATQGYEIGEMLLRGRLPQQEILRGRSFDYYVQTIAAGMGPIGYYLAMQRMQKWTNGRIKVPRVIVTEITEFAPIQQAWDQQLERVGPEVATPYFPDGPLFEPTLWTTNIAAYYPHLRKMLLDTNGDMLAVSPRETQQAAMRYEILRELENMGYKFTETENASFVGFAGLAKMVEDGKIPKGSKAILMLTGKGQRQNFILEKPDFTADPGVHKPRDIVEALPICTSSSPINGEDNALNRLAGVFAITSVFILGVFIVNKSMSYFYGKSLFSSYVDLYRQSPVWVAGFTAAIEGSVAEFIGYYLARERKERIRTWISTLRVTGVLLFRLLILGPSASLIDRLIDYLLPIGKGVCYFAFISRASLSLVHGIFLSSVINFLAPFASYQLEACYRAKENNLAGAEFLKHEYSVRKQLRRTWDSIRFRIAPVIIQHDIIQNIFGYELAYKILSRFGLGFINSVFRSWLSNRSKKVELGSSILWLTVAFAPISFFWGTKVLAISAVMLEAGILLSSKISKSIKTRNGNVRGNGNAPSTSDNGDSQAKVRSSSPVFVLKGKKAVSSPVQTTTMDKQAFLPLHMVEYAPQSPSDRWQARRKQIGQKETVVVKAVCNINFDSLKQADVRVTEGASRDITLAVVSHLEGLKFICRYRENPTVEAFLQNIGKKEVRF
ncbi:MAG: pyridoxal-phosphate dependent enzyme, partial [Candidatus Omnitrophota bacterium]